MIKKIINNQTMNISKITLEFLQQTRNLSFTSFWEFCKAPCLYLHYLNKPDDDEDSDALIVGKLTHVLTLQRDTVNDTYAIAPECDRRTKEGKAIYNDFVAANEGKEIVSAKLYEQAKEMSDSILAHPLAMSVLYPYNQEGVNEYRFEYEYDGLPFVGYIDKYFPTHKCEIKTVQSAVYKKIQNDFYDKGYHVQYGIYDTACHTVDNYYICVEKKAPYLVSVFRASDSYINYGKRILRQRSEDFKDCLRNDTFHAGYEIWTGGIIEDLSLPGWLKIE